MPSNTCTPEKPKPADAEGRWIHPQAKCIGDSYGGLTDGNFERYECPNCGEKFWVELPD